MPPPPLNVPAGQQATGGVQPGQSNAVVFANKVIVFGTSDGLFVYSGAPGPGTLLASVTTATTDPFGNTTQPGGFVIYDGSAYIDMHVNTGVGAPAVEMVTGVASEASHAALYTLPLNTALVNEMVETVLTGAGSSSGGIQALVYLLSAAADGSQAAAGVLATDAAGVFTTRAFWDVTGFQTLGPGGGSGWYAGGTQTDATSHPQTNIVTTSFGNVTAAWTIPANDVNVGTVYEIEMPFTGVHEGIQLNIGVNFGGTFTNVVPLGAAWITTGHSYVGSVRLKLTFTAKGSSGAANIDIDGTVQDSGSARTPATSMTLNGHTTLGDRHHRRPRVRHRSELEQHERQPVPHRTGQRLPPQRPVGMQR